MRYFFTILIFLGLIEQVKSQEKWQFQHLDSNSGLSTETVNCTFKDSKGFIWIGTIDGLNKFDGYNITVYKSDIKQSESISGNVITTIAEDFDGNIWIGTRNNGISIYDPKTGFFRKIKQNGVEGLPVGAIQKILVANKNNILIGLEEGGFCNYVVPNNKIINYKANPNNQKSITSNSIFSIIESEKDQFWIGNHRGGVDLFDLESQTFRRLTYDKNIKAGEKARQILYFGESGNLWIGTHGDGLIKLDPATLQYTQYTKENSGINSNIIKTIYQDNQGFIYLGTDGGGINIINPNNDSFSYIENDLYNDKSLSSNAVYEIYEDNSGIIWVSTFRGGVNFYSRFSNKFQLIEKLPDNLNSLSLNSVIALEESNDGSIWIGTDGGGLDRLDLGTNTFQHFTHSNNPNSISSNVPISLLEDNMGFLWVGTYAGGLNKFDPNTSKFKHYLPDPNNTNSIGSLNVWAIVEDSKNQLWFGLLDGGLARYDKSKDGFTHFTADGKRGSISSNLVISMFSDSKNNLWVGTEDAGLNLFNEKNSSFKVIRNDPNDTNSLLNDNVRCIYEDQSGVLWVGTANGMNQIDLATMKVNASPVNELLPNLVINGILEDESHQLWISTNRGLSKYSPYEHEIQNFSTEDGLQGNEFNYTASLKSQNGRMYFGGIKGLNYFSPKNVKISDLNPEVIFSSIKLFDKSIYDYPKSQLAIESPLQYLKKIELQHDQNVLEIEFAALDYTSPSSNKYRYKLEGFDQGWNYTNANKRSANYTNLDAGDYLFRVEGTNSDGVWSSNIRTLQLKVLPPWWSTFWFRFLVLILLSSILILIYRWRRNLTIQQKRELEQRVEEATHQVKLKNDVLEKEQLSLQDAIEDTNYVIQEAINSGNFSARIETENKAGEWKALGESINKLFDSILSPFNAVNMLTNSMAKSDLSKRFKDKEKGDVKKLMDNLNFALDNLSNLLRKIINQTEEITASSHEVLHNSEEMNSSTQEISSSIAEMSRGAQNQVQRIDDTSNILESILNTSTDIGDQAETIYSGSERGTKLSNDGKKTIDQVEVGIQKVLTISNQTNDAIKMLSDRSTEISRVLKIINSISSQTNLLALNAAIEAAKAGDAGRGFSVVAEEIRKLADDSRRSTSDIEFMISEIQNAIESTAKLINEMSGDIETSVDASSEASKTFTKISSSYEQTLKLSEKIVGATKSQTSSVKQVVEFMENVVVISEQTAAGTEEIATSANQLKLGMNQSSDKIKKVTDIVKELRDNVNEFTLEENQEDE